MINVKSRQEIDAQSACVYTRVKYYVWVQSMPFPEIQLNRGRVQSHIEVKYNQISYGKNGRSWGSETRYETC